MPGAPGRRSRGGLLLRLAVVVAVVCLALVGRSLLLRYAQEDMHREVQREQAHLHEESLRTVVGLRGLSLRNFAADYSLWDDMATFAEAPDATWAATNLDPSLATFKISYLWVFDRRGAPRYHAAAGPPLPELPGADRGVAAMLARSAFDHYFVRLPDGTLVEVRGARIQPSHDAARVTEPLGYLFAAIRWDAPYVEELRALTGGEPSVVDPASECARAPGGTSIMASHDLPGHAGNAARLCLRVPNPTADLLTRFARIRFLTSLAFAGILFAALSFMLHLLVVRPLRIIAAAIATGDTAALAPVEGRSDEFGDLARVVHDHQRGAVEREALRSQVYQAGKLASLGVLGAGVAHELNNPLAAVLGHADMLVAACEAGPLDVAEVQESAQTILTQSERMRGILEHVRELNGAESGPPRRAPASLNRLTRDALLFLGAYLEARQVEVVLDLADGLPDVACEAGMFESVVQNLVLNAADELASLAPGAPRTIVVQTALDGPRGSVLLRVKDEGRGIPESVRDRIFEPFFTTKPVGKGTGLGLALVHAMVERHGGTVSFTTSERGTTFEVVLPVASPTEVPTHAS